MTKPYYLSTTKGFALFDSSQLRSFSKPSTAKSKDGTREDKEVLDWKFFTRNVRTAHPFPSIEDAENTGNELVRRGFLRQGSFTIVQQV